MELNNLIRKIISNLIKFDSNLVYYLLKIYIHMDDYSF